jgi:aldose 1-epimerase
MRTIFGSLDDGTAIEEVVLAAGETQARVITWGAVLRDLVVADRAGRPRRVVLGLRTLADYLHHSRNFGAVCGRVANRIGGARFVLDGIEHRLTPNLPGGHILHGGDGALGLKPWRIVTAARDSVTLEIVSPAGEAGFPGTVTARCTYALPQPGVLQVILQAEADAPTPVNLAHHSYFNLGDGMTIASHRLHVAADFFTPTDAEGIPTGEVRSVAGTPYDFRAGRLLGGANAARPGYDINLVLARAGASGLMHAATLSSPDDDLRLELSTNAPGLQVFDAHTIAVPVAGLHGHPYAPRCGVALEPQFFPDAPNHAHFPSCILRPGEVFRQQSVFRFL